MDNLIKQPGLAVETAPVSLNFSYADRFDIAHLVGYESQLYDLFTGVISAGRRNRAGWAAVQPFLDLWAKGGKPDPYTPGSMGPDAADTLLSRDSRHWHAPVVVNAEEKKQ
jgi:glucose-6-phosphate 1-dehydrogenase